MAFLFFGCSPLAAPSSKRSLKPMTDLSDYRYCHYVMWLVYPHMVIPCSVGRDNPHRGAWSANAGNKQVLLVRPKRDASEDDPGATGVIAWVP